VCASRFSMAALKFKELAVNDLATTTVPDGCALTQLAGDALLARGRALGLPSLGDEPQTRMLIGALHTACEVGVPHKGTWSELREEVRGLLLLALRREGRVSAKTAEALNVLNKPPVIEKYQVFGNRWTMPEASREMVEAAKRELDASSSVTTTEWLRSLADALDEPVDERPWWTSTPVLLVLFLASLFILAHVVLLARVLFKVHDRDNSVLFLPIAGLSASALVGAFAIGIHKMSGGGEMPATASSKKQAH